LTLEEVFSGFKADEDTGEDLIGVGLVKETEVPGGVVVVELLGAETEVVADGGGL